MSPAEKDDILPTAASRRRYKTRSRGCRGWDHYIVKQLNDFGTSSRKAECETLAKSLTDELADMALVYHRKRKEA
jgi:hypothetical protein